MSGRITTIATPKKLYRYRSLADKHDDELDSKAKKELKAIRENYLWSSSYKDMNDPMEGLYKSENTLRNNMDLYGRLFEAKQSIGIVSFSETATNELMWAHYTNNMRGICIEYDVPRLLKALKKGDELVRMTYDEDMHTIRKNSKINNLARSILARKNHRWSQEREWRLLTDRMHRVDYFDPTCITQIILRPQMDDVHMNKFKNLETHYDIKFIDVDGYRLKVRSFDDPFPVELS